MNTPGTGGKARLDLPAALEHHLLHLARQGGRAK
jgi:hypothetical protein